MLGAKDHQLIFWAEGKRYPANWELLNDAFAQFATYPVGENGWQAVAIVHGGEEVAFKGNRYPRPLRICTSAVVRFPEA